MLSYKKDLKWYGEKMNMQIPIQLTHKITPVFTNPLETVSSGNQEPDFFIMEQPNDTFLKQKETNPEKFMGGIGATIGAQTGKAVYPVLYGVMGGILGAPLGPAGVAVGAIAGAAAGEAFEKVSGAGKIIVGMAGGAIGKTAGKIANHLKETQTTEQNKEPFSMMTLFKQLATDSFRGLRPISDEDKKMFMKNIRPGDIIIMNDDRIDFEPVEKIAGATGNWTHAAYVKDDKNTIEMWLEGYRERTIEELLSKNHHMMLLRPDYKDEESREKMSEEIQKYSAAKYDFAFDMTSDDKLYCTELIYKSLKAVCPEIHIDPLNINGYKAVSADELVKSKDMSVIASTGSDFKTNFLSRYGQI